MRGTFAFPLILGSDASAISPALSQPEAIAQGISPNFERSSSCLSTPVQQSPARQYPLKWRAILMQEPQVVIICNYTDCPFIKPALEQRIEGAFLDRIQELRRFAHGILTARTSLIVGIHSFPQYRRIDTDAIAASFSSVSAFLPA